MIVVRKRFCTLQTSLSFSPSVDHVASKGNGKVPSDTSRQGFDGVSLANELASILDDVVALKGHDLASHSTRLNHFTFPDHGNDGARAEKLDQAGEKRLARQVGVVLACKVLGGHDHLEADELVSALLKSLDNVANEAALRAVRLSRDADGEQLGD